MLAPPSLSCSLLCLSECLLLSTTSSRSFLALWDILSISSLSFSFLEPIVISFHGTFDSVSELSASDGCPQPGFDTVSCCRRPPQDPLLASTRKRFLETGVETAILIWSWLWWCLKPSASPIFRPPPCIALFFRRRQ